MSSTDLTTWKPSTLLSPSAPITPFSLIILNQPLSLRPTIYSTLFTHSQNTLAADGGANRLYDLLHSSTTTSSSTISPYLPLSLIIGDLDSLQPHVRSHFSSQNVQIIHDPDQNSTDFGKAFQWLHSHQENEAVGIQKEMDIIVLGGLGGRIDQGLSVLHHFYMFQSSLRYEEGKMYLLSSDSITFLLKAGKHRIQVKQEALFEAVVEGEGRVKWGLGKHIGIIPMKEASVITTKGLEWDVEDWKTEFGGLISTSNWVREDWVDVETSGDVLFTVDLKVEVSDGVDGRVIDGCSQVKDGEK